MQVIAIAHNGFKDKFGIPRQSGMTQAETRLVIEKPFARAEAFRGIDQFSHLWLIWHFDAQPSLTVRPPRLGGNRRLGVFATRSPYRPNQLGLTVVKLVRVEQSDGITLVVSGADLQDGTEIYDIKPYLSYVDSVPEAQNGFAGEAKDYRLQVEWMVEPPCDEMTRNELEELLAQDPRPSYQNDPERVYGMTYKGWEVKFRVDAGLCFITTARPGNR